MIYTVLDKNVDTKLKLFVIEQLNLAKDAVINYKISGCEGLRKAFDQAMGTLLIHKDTLKDILDEEEISKLSKIFSTLKNLSYKATTQLAIAAGIELGKTLLIQK